MFIESLVALVVFANVTVPVIPDPDYLQQLYPSPTGLNTFGMPVTQQPENDGSTQPTDIAGILSLVATGAVGYLFQRNKTTMDRRTYMAADTTVKLAANDQASDVKNLDIVYALSCVGDIMGKHHREDMETYMTRDGVSLWTYLEILNKRFNQDFTSRYVNTGPVPTTGTESKDRVVATFNKVQQSITPTAPTTPLVELFTSGTATTGVSGAAGRVQANIEANEQAATEQTVKTTPNNKETAVD